MPKRKAPSTAWKPGQSGNPEGRKFDKVLTDQIRIVLNETDKATGYKRLRLLAEKIVEQAIDGGAPQQVMVAERIEGKVPNENHNTNELAENTLEALLRAVDGRSRDIVAPQANGHDTADDGETVH